MSILNIPWCSKYIPHVPFASQLQFLLLPHKDALFGGQAGGGKSDVLLMAALQYADTPGYSALLLRRTLTELKQNEALLDRASQWLSGVDGVHYKADEHTYHFDTYWADGTPAPSAKLQFGYLGDYRVEERYQGAEFSFVGIDEAGHFESDSAPRYLFSRIRKKVCHVHKLKTDPVTGKKVANYVKGCMYCDVYKSIPLRFRMSCNPGGPGHLWIRNRYKIQKQVYDDIDPKTKEITKRIRWIGGDPNRPFIPSSLKDNLFIDQDSYESSLDELDEVRKLQLKYGDWDASPDSRFRLIDARFYKSKAEFFILNGVAYHYRDLKKVFITADSASTAQEMGLNNSSVKKEPCYTVYSVWGLTHDYQLIWIYMYRTQAEIPECIRNLVRIYKTFRPQYVKMETNGVGIGPAQLAASFGLNVVPNHKAKDKIQNSGEAQIRMRAHRIWFPEDAPWLKECLDEIFTWTGHPGMLDDIVDTLSDACNDIAWDAQNRDPMLTQDSVNGEMLTQYLPQSIPLSLQHQKQFFSNNTFYLY